MRPLCLVGALLLGVMSAPPAMAQNPIDSITNFFGGDETEPGDGTAFDDADDDSGACGGDGRITLNNARVAQGLGVVDDAALNAYLNAIMAKLVAASKRPNCRVTVWVTPHDAPQAIALGDGGVLVTMGFLRNFENEDEAAALLAHEVSHILENHHASDAFVDSQDAFLSGLDSANAAGSVMAQFVDPRLSQGLQDASLAGGLAFSVSESLIAPAWTRDQEDDADLLGTDLLVRAGYNPRAMAAIMDIIKAQEANLGKVDAERERLRTERLNATAIEAAQQSSTGDIWSIARSLANLTIGAIENASESSKAEHRPAEERKANINEYVRAHYKKDRRRKFKKQAWLDHVAEGPSAETFMRYRQAAEARRLIYADGDIGKAQALAEQGVTGRFSSHAYPRLAFSEVQARMGNRDVALVSLMLVMQGDGAPWNIYRSASELHLVANDDRAAGDVVTRADESLGHPLGIAPYAIMVFRRLNDDARVKEYLARCGSEGTRAHLAACLDEAGMTNQQYQQLGLVKQPSGTANQSGETIQKSSKSNR